jgi:hypothetical protein
VKKSTAEERAELIAMGRELIKVMREVIEPINRLTCRLDQEATALLPHVLSEQAEAGETPNTLHQVTGKRFCSKCRKSGHRSPNCPLNK